MDKIESARTLVLSLQQVQSLRAQQKPFEPHSDVEQLIDADDLPCFCSFSCVLKRSRRAAARLTQESRPSPASRSWPGASL